MKDLIKNIAYLLLTLTLFTACSKSSSSNLYPEVDSSHPLDKGLPKKNYSYPSTAYNITKALPSGYNKNGSVNYTKYIQKAIDENKEVVFPDFPVLIGSPGLRIKSDKKIYFQENSKLIMEPTSSGNYYMILILDAENVTIKNVYLEGDRNVHLGTTGEWGYGIYISGSKNVLIDGAHIKNCWGDGIVLTKDGWNNPSENVHIVNSLIDSSRRSGITIGSGHNILIENTIMQNSNGPHISSGFTIEPNNRTNDVNNVTLKNCLTKGNERVGIRLVTTNLYGAGGELKNCNLKFINHKDDSSQFGLTFVLGSKNKSGGLNPSTILFENCFLVNNRTNAIADYTENGSNVLFDVYFDGIYPIQENGKINQLQMDKITKLIEKTNYFHFK